MTLEEASNILKGAIKKPNTKDGYLGQAITMGVNSLEAWEKVKAEIGKLKRHEGKWMYGDDLPINWTVSSVLIIIDKHLQEVTTDADSN